MIFERRDGENEVRFLWRIGQAKDNGTIGLSWEEIAAVMNKEFREDVSEYLGESAYRKQYQQAKRFYEGGVFNSISEDDYVSQLREAKHEIQREKQKLFDERTALNRTLRENARVEEDLSKLEALIKNNSVTTLPKIQNRCGVSDNDLCIALSDIHLGLDTNNYFGTYNSNVATERLAQYLDRIIKIKELHGSENAYVFLLGDLLSGDIHFTIQLENRENIIEQVQKTAELVSKFIYELSKHFNNVFVNGVAGNHSRTSFKDQVLRGNRLDNLIPWYMKAKLSHIDNISFVDDDNYDATIGCCAIRGHRYWLVHGDFDSFSENGVSKLVLMMGYKPTAIFYGHLHRCSYDEISDVKIIRSGSFSGASDDYTISKRMSGSPSQMVCVVDGNGINAFYPIELK